MSDRVLGISALAAAVLAVFALTILLGDPDTASRSSVAASTAVYVVAMAALIVFAASLGSRAPQSIASSLVALATADATLQVASVMPRAALNYRANLHVEAATTRLLLDLGRVINYGSDLILAAFLAVVASCLWRADSPNRGLSVVACGTAICAVAAAVARGGPAGFATYWLFIVWLVSMGVYGLRGRLDLSRAAS